MLKFIENLDWRRFFVILVPMMLALLHATGYLRLGFVERADDLIYDTRLRATMPATLEERIVIIDIDEKSLAEYGRWPWSRNHIARLVNSAFDRYGVMVMGFDVVFGEKDNSSGLHKLEELGVTDFADNAQFQNRLAALRSELDYDSLLDRSLRGRAVVLGYYFTSDREGAKSGLLPAPVLNQDALQGRPIRFYAWNGYGANIRQLASSAPLAGYFNIVTSADGAVRSMPLLSEYDGNYYEALSLAMYRVMTGMPAVELGFPEQKMVGKKYHALDHIALVQNGAKQKIPVDDKVAILVPYRGKGGPRAGSFNYYSAVDVIQGRVDTNALKGKVALVGTTAPALLDLRSTPVGEAYPGVEAHANVISALMEGSLKVKPDYAVGFEAVQVVFIGLLMALLLPLLSASRAVVFSVTLFGVFLVLNLMAYMQMDLVLPLAGTVLMMLACFSLNMSYGYFVESRSKRELASLFGSYVPPALVDVMVKDPATYSMKAQSKEMTVMFCDMRGFTKLSENMDPLELQRLLNEIFERLTAVIASNRGTIDKYIGDCIMAFWGAPVDQPDHAAMAVKAATEMMHEIQAINNERKAQNREPIGLGVGINTGRMCVGDMGSSLRQAYTVIGDAVNLAARLESLCPHYRLPILVSGAVARQSAGFVWQHVEKVTVKGRSRPVELYTPRMLSDEAQDEAVVKEELRLWKRFIKAYSVADLDQCEMLLLNLNRLNANYFLYAYYAEKIQLARIEAERGGSRPDKAFASTTATAPLELDRI